MVKEICRLVGCIESFSSVACERMALTNVSDEKFKAADAGVRHEIQVTSYTHTTEVYAIGDHVSSRIERLKCR